MISADESSEITLRMVKNEMTLYEATKGQTRPVHLEQLYRALKSIKPSSIDPERGFSAMGYFCTKIRSRMGDDVLDAIIFMQEYYKNNESNGQDSGAQKTPKTPTNQNPGTSRMNQATLDPNITISADPVVMKRGRVESGSIKNAKKSKPDSNSITNVESDESLDIDLDETQLILGSNKTFVSQATPRTQNAHVIRCTPGTSRFQAPDTPKSSRSGNRTSRSQSTRGSMFQPQQTSNSVFTFQSSTIDANQTISEDPAIKERGPVQHFKDTFIDDSDIL